MDIEQARRILAEAGARIAPNGHLCDIGRAYVSAGPAPERATLDGDFDVDTLEAIVIWMRNPASLNIRVW